MQYPSEPRVRAHSPRQYAAYRTYQRCVRLEFTYRCVYCLAAEPEVAPGAKSGGFEIEHFRPQARFRKLTNSYDNLAWACASCNAAKGDTWPTDAEVAEGYGFPDLDAALAEHLEVQGDVVVPLTRAGEYLLVEVNLNSRLHVERRQKRSLAKHRIETLRKVLAAKEEALSTAVRQALQTELDDLEHRLFGEPWDAVASCGCGVTPSSR